MEPFAIILRFRKGLYFKSDPEYLVGLSSWFKTLLLAVV